MITKLKRGTPREDGMIFWKYVSHCKNGEWWVTPEKLNILKTKESEIKKRMFLNSPEKVKNQRNSYYQKNKEVILCKFRDYYQKNKEKLKYRSRSNYTNNKERAIAWSTNHIRKKRKEDNLFYLSQKIRRLILHSLTNKGFTKKSRTYEILGCGFEDFKKHIESQFADGMSWENRFGWHIDHIIPISSANTEEDVIRLNHYTNLQPLWAADNIRKGNKMP